MESSGDAYVDARRCDAMKYVFRKKEGWLKDLIKARNCIDAAIKRLESLKAIKENKIEIGDIVNYKSIKKFNYEVKSISKSGSEAKVVDVNTPSNQGWLPIKDLVKL